MQVRDAEITRLIERLGDHYRSNIANRFIRPALLQLPMEKQSWDLIDTLTEKIEEYRYQGFNLDELYHQILAMARFISCAKRELLPNLRYRLPGGSGSDRVLRDMAVSNFSANLKLLTDQLNELYVALVEFDKKTAKNKKPLYLSIPELQDFGRLLLE
jgi:hypothetical protein